MKWLFAFAAVHGIQFSDDQCRVLRQVRLAAPECHAAFANTRTVAANFSARSPGVPGSAPGASAPGGSLGAGGSPANGSTGAADAGSTPSGPSAPGSGSSAPGSPAGGNPGNPGGGAGRPGESLPPLPTPEPPKPAIDLATLAKIRSELRDRLVDRIVFGFKPPDRPDRPNFKPPDRPGRPSSKPGVGDALGPGGLRGASSQGSSGPSRR